jgi:acetyl esterase/lipase
MSDLLRFFGGLIFLGLASLTAFPPPTHMLWQASVAATEGGHWLALAAIVPVCPMRGQGRLGRLGAILSLGAIALFVMPVVRAKGLNAELPGVFDARFGADQRERGRFAENPRPEPIVLTELLTKVNSRPVRLEERVFSTSDGQKLTLDVYRPGYEHGPLPGVLVVHGGGWQHGHSRDFMALNGYLAARDYIVASINYRLAPKFRFPAGRDDVLSAIAYLKVYAREIGLDATRLAVLGRSSGAQLALLAAYTASEPGIRGAISVYGPTDMRFGYERPAPKAIFDTRNILEAYLGGPPDKVDDAYFAASPINFVSASSPPTLMIHGLRDTLVSPDESARLEERLKKSSVRHLFVRLPWATHGCDWSFSGPCGQVTTYAVERFLAGVMYEAQPKETSKTRLAANRPKQR